MSDNKFETSQQNSQSSATKFGFPKDDAPKESELNDSAPKVALGDIEANERASEFESVVSKEKQRQEQNGSKTLEDALEKYGVVLPSKKVQQLKEYCELLWTWNERLNLTRHTTFDKFVSRDLIDSIHLANQLQKGEHVLDVGSGGGVPGLVVALLRPDVVVELCESTGKKAEALGAIVDELGLDLNIWYAKAEDLLRTRHFHTLTIRAVGKIRGVLLMFAPVWHAFNRLLLIKGPNWVAERGEARHYNMFNTLALRKVDEYENPGAEHGSVILQICRKTRVEEMKRRAKERVEGKPYDGRIEEIVVDNKTRDFSISNEDRNKSRRGNARTQHRGKRNFKTSVKVRDQRSLPTSEVTNVPRDVSCRSEEPVTVFSRRNGKAPKGWTGKKKDFNGKRETFDTFERPHDSSDLVAKRRNIGKKRNGS